MKQRLSGREKWRRNEKKKTKAKDEEREKGKMG